MKKSRIRIFLSVVVSAEILMSSSASANGLLPATVNQITPAVMPSIPETISATGIDSMQSIEAKISDIFKPEKKKAKLAEPYSGTCGTNVNWNLDTTTGELTISGSGAMTDSFDGNKAPWKLYKDSLKTVTIEHGVTYISDSAFSEYKKLIKVTIPSSITSIGSHAFSFCSSLTSVTIPDSVVNTGTYAFRCCDSLTSVIIPSSVTLIPSSFDCCSSLTAITVDSNNTRYKSIDGVLFNKAGTRLEQYPSGKSGSYVIPDFVAEISGSAFSSSKNLMEVTIPNSLTSIGVHAFSSCTSLTSVTIPALVKFLGECAFKDCSNLVKMIYMGTKDPVDPSADSVFLGTNVSVVDVPTNYEGNTLGGLPIKKMPSAIFTELGDYFASRLKQTVLCGVFQFLMQ